jgi:hypothetical protein
MPFLTPVIKNFHPIWVFKVQIRKGAAQTNALTYGMPGHFFKGMPKGH